MTRSSSGRSLASALLAATALTACAANPPSPLQQPGEQTVGVSMDTPDGRLDQQIRREQHIGITTVAAARPQAWEHLLAAWQELGLVDPAGDPRTFTLRVTERVVMRRLGDTPLSVYLDCGRSMTGWNADTHRVRLTVHSLLERVSADSTRVHTRVDAVAHSTGGASAAPMACTTKGVLESRVGQRVAQHAAQAAGR